jgi:hypothetical protein
MRTITLLLISVALAFRAAASEPQILRLDVVCDFGMRTEEQMKSGLSILRIRSSLTNVGTQAVTVPTTSFDGQPHMVTTGQTHLDVCFQIGFVYMKHRRMTPSPIRFFPVLLQPGESTELPVYEEPVRHPELIKKVSVEFEVQEDYARNQRWWYGTVQKEIAVNLGEPNKVSQSTTPAVTPPAGQEARQP